MAETALARSRAHSQFATLPIERVCGRLNKSLRVVLGARYLSTIEIHAATHDVTTAAGIDVLLRAVDTLRSGLAIKNCFVILHRIASPLTNTKLRCCSNPYIFSNSYHRRTPRVARG